MLFFSEKWPAVQFPNTYCSKYLESWYFCDKLDFSGNHEADLDSWEKHVLKLRSGAQLGDFERGAQVYLKAEIIHGLSPSVKCVVSPLLLET